MRIVMNVGDAPLDVSDPADPTTLLNRYRLVVPSFASMVSKTERTADQAGCRPRGCISYLFDNRIIAMH
jgi:hypothetical protein